jgi:UDP:flavonoid glycosyltransferase YjiC (YdhE family)
LRNEEINLIVVVGRDQEPTAFGPQPPNVYIERYIPHALLLPRCDVMITHCGFSSVMACLELVRTVGTRSTLRLFEGVTA